MSNIGSARRDDEKGVATIGTRIGIVREAVALGRKIFEFGLLGTGQIACDADRCDGGTHGHRFIETKRLGPARKARKKLDSADDPADDGKVANEMARRVADNGIEFGADAGNERHIPTDDEHAIAMYGPKFAVIGSEAHTSEKQVQ